jgi:GntR family transcriptional regulator, rspAB operon transcriptional repressor
VLKRSALVYTAGMRASDSAYTALQDDILEGRLAPGTVLGEVGQSERLGVSRTPIREAFSRLIAAGLAVQQPGRGTVVSDISLEDVDRLFEVRIPLETQAAGLAAQRGTPEVFAALAEEFRQAQRAPEAESHYKLAARMDEAIDTSVGNTYMSTMLANLRVHLIRVRRLAKDQPERLAESAAEHRDICLGIASGDPQMAEAATSLHLRRSLAYISELRQAEPVPSP